MLNRLSISSLPPPRDFTAFILFAGEVVQFLRWALVFSLWFISFQALNQILFIAFNSIFMQVPEALIPPVGARVMSLTDGLSKVMRSIVKVNCRKFLIRMVISNFLHLGL